MTKSALIFDFGNVIARFDVMRAADHLGRHAGISGPELLERVQARGFMALAREYEHGRIPCADFSAQVCAMVDLALPFEQFADAWCDIFDLNEPVAQLAVQLKDRGHRLILGSNTNELHSARFRKQFAHVLDRFDSLVLSHRVGAMKPDPQFYQVCVQEAGLPPDQCVFIDDLAENVDAARGVGLHGIQYRDIDALRAELASLGIKVD